MEFNIAKRGKLSITKALLLNAFFDLAKTKKTSEMTVKELTERAQISRASFYNHYREIDELFLEYFRSVIEPRFEAELASSKFENTYEYGLFFFDFNYREKEFYMLLDENNRLTYILDVLIDQQRLPNLKKSLNKKSNTVFNEKDFEYANSYYAGGLYTMMNHWIKNGMKDSPKRLAKIYSKIGPMMEA